MAILDNFDRSNVTIQTATSRASGYFDSGNPYRYHVTEISDYNTLQTFYETAHKDKVFTKVGIDGSDIVLLKEVLNYGTQKTGEDRDIVLKYTGNV